MVVYDYFTHTTVEMVMEHDGKILEPDEPENLGKIQDMAKSGRCMLITC